MESSRTVRQVLRKYADAAAEEIARLAEGAPDAPVTLRRTAAQLARAADKVHKYLSKHQGIGVEALAWGMRCETRALTRPLQMLQEAGRVTTEGAKRAMRYTAVTP
jgi:hypothetical protein